MTTMGTQARIAAPATVTESITTTTGTCRRTAYRPALKSGRGGLRTRRSPWLTAIMGVLFLYSILPLFWLFINASKTQGALFNSFGLWFSGDFALFDNIVRLFTYDDGIFGRWFANTLMYVVIGAGGSTLLAALGGYALSKFDFAGKRAVFVVILAAVAVPGTALAVPTFLLFSQLGLTNTPWAVIVPSLVTPFGLYLMWTFANDAIPNELLEAARIDGSGEFRTFFSISLRLLAPGLVSVLLLEIVGSWNNYFLPLIMLSNPDWYPLTVGLGQWNAQAESPSGEVIYDLVITGSLVTIVPIIIAFLLLQRFWQSGLASGAVKA